MKKYYAIFAGAFALACASCVSGVFTAGAPTDLTVGEFFENPLGYSLESPSFSWRLPAGDGQRQTAYRIVVTGEPSMSAESVVWDSGKVESAQNIKVPFPKSVKSREKLYWKVRFWNADGKPSAWSAVNHFEAGLDSADWRASWLSSSDEPRPRSGT